MLKLLMRMVEGLEPASRFFNKTSFCKKLFPLI